MVGFDVSSLFGTPSSSVVGWGSLVLLWRNRWRWVSMARCRPQVCVLVMLVSKPILLGKWMVKQTKSRLAVICLRRRGQNMVYLELSTLKNSEFCHLWFGIIWCFVVPPRVGFGACFSRFWNDGPATLRRILFESYQRQAMWRVQQAVFWNDPQPQNIQNFLCKKLGDVLDVLVLQFVGSTDSFLETGSKWIRPIDCPSGWFSCSYSLKF